MSNNYYSDHVKTVQIDAEIRNGEFVDVLTGKPIELEEATPVIMIVPRNNLSKTQLEEFKTIKRVLLPEGSRMWFDLPKVHLRVYLETLDEVVFKSSGNKIPKAEECPCMITEITNIQTQQPLKDFEPFEVTSLNQAFYQTSIRYRSEANSHTTNIYTQYTLVQPFSGQSLNSVRGKFYDDQLF